MRDAVLLLAHGAPERSEEVGEYLMLVRGGRPLAPELVEEIRSRYDAIGGGSPLTARTQAQAAALERKLAADGLPVHVYFGMRNWRPSILETMSRMKADGVERIAAICLAPQYSKFSIGLYFRRTQEAKTQLGFNAEILWAKSYHDHPLLIEAFAQRLTPMLPAQMVLFTAHSLPEKILETADAYDAEAKATARAVAARLGLERWEFAYQSQGLTDEKWLGPTVESRIDEYAQAGIQDLVLAPIGFVSDHVEILYDVDILFRNYAAERGIRLRRPESLNDSPTFIAALADVARQKLGAG
ncbi:MAG: ferrochelatase [Bryobacteraceae bacterium]|nr:ferrochelatase [Bryobacteraceae bacterium]